MAHKRFKLLIFVSPPLVRAGLLFLSLVFAQALQAQPRPDSLGTKRPAPVATSKVEEEPLVYTYAVTPEKIEMAADTLPDANFRMYNPARQQTIDYGTLGNLGSSARPLLYEVLPQLGFGLGIHAFDLYTVGPQDLRFYRNSRSFSDAFFSQGKNNQEAMLNARFARTFSGGTNISLDYRSINNIGQYNYQRDRQWHHLDGDSQYRDRVWHDPTRCPQRCYHRRRLGQPTWRRLCLRSGLHAEASCASRDHQPVCNPGT